MRPRRIGLGTTWLRMLGLRCRRAAAKAWFGPMLLRLVRFALAASRQLRVEWCGSFGRRKRCSFGRRLWSGRGTRTAERRLLPVWFFCLLALGLRRRGFRMRWHGARGVRAIRPRLGRRRRWRRGPRHILHDFAQRRRCTGLDAFACPGEYVIGDGRGRPCRYVARRRQCGLQGPDGVIECQPVGFENLCGRASRVADNCGQHDRAVDIAPAASARGRSRSLEDAPNVLRYAEGIMTFRRRFSALQDARDDISLQAFSVDLASIQHRGRIGIVAEGREQMLKRNLCRAARPGKVGPPCQCGTEIRRHRNLRNICGRHAHDVSQTEGQDGQDWPGLNALTCRKDMLMARYSNGMILTRQNDFSSPDALNACVSNARGW